MSQLMITEEQQRFLDESREPVEIVDRTGRVLTRLVHGFNEFELNEAASAARDFTPAGELRDTLTRLKSHR